MTPTLVLVSTARAKDHLRVAGVRFDADIDFKIQAASHIVLDYLKIYPPDFYSPVGSATWEDWDADGAPELVQAATLLVLGELFESRESASDPLSAGVKAILHRYRDPAMA
jgi:hypothetical protein